MLDSSKDGQKLDAMKMIIGVWKIVLTHQEQSHEHLKYRPCVDGGQGKGLFQPFPSCRQECGL